MAATANILEPSTICTQGLWSSARDYHWFLGYISYKDPPPPSDCEASSESWLFQIIQNDEASVLLGTFSKAEMFFFYILPQCNPVYELWRQFSDLVIDFNSSSLRESVCIHVYTHRTIKRNGRTAGLRFKCNIKGSEHECQSICIIIRAHKNKPPCQIKPVQMLHKIPVSQEWER